MAGRGRMGVRQTAFKNQRKKALGKRAVGPKTQTQSQPKPRAARTQARPVVIMQRQPQVQQRPVTTLQAGITQARNDLFDAFTNTKPLPDSLTFGHFTPCRSYIQFGISTAFSTSSSLTANSVANTSTSTPNCDLCVWINWQPSAVSAILFNCNNGTVPGTSLVQMIGAPQFFPTTYNPATAAASFPTGVPDSARPIRTSIRISCTTQEVNRQGGVSCVVLPQGIGLTKWASGSAGSAGIFPYGSSNCNLGIGEATRFGGISGMGIASIVALLNGQGAEFIPASALANKSHQWDLTPASFVGFHSYTGWQQATTVDATPTTYAGQSLNTSNNMTNLCSWVDLQAFASDSELNVSNAIFVFKGAGLTNPQTYNIEIAHMIAARFQANTLLANSAVLPSPDPSGVVQKSAAAISAAGSAPRPTRGGRNGSRVRTK